MSDLDPSIVLSKIRNFFKILLDHRYLIMREKQGFKSNLYWDLWLFVIEIGLLFFGWLFFHTHQQALFNLFVASFVIDVAFLLICFTFFATLYYLFDREA